ncbi:hypothetical protein CKO11_02250 [Rhodobacter sp. TJ_12]|uniref:DUF302 domain-containing protein n=1 Tax=Rhodobacter sp. TJ_12 TaxID=2029399 RepID=UPI001CBF2CD5|nr:DUF302 domain-containing protein [Rhodobacter sp. TJ_12]MBZ4021284.1 hypothetical protein [Rhodobacter sp. TJ_12]
MRYTLNRILENTAFEEAEARTRAALTARGFGVITEIDVAATMKAKLDREMTPYKILGACNPPRAFEALQADPRIGAMLPCNVIVRAVERGVEVSAVDPVASFAQVEAEGARAVAAEVREIYVDLIANL